MRPALLLITASFLFAAEPEQRRVISAAAPSYPRTRIGAVESGEVVFDCKVAPSGLVLEARPRPGTAAPEVLRNAASLAVRQWRFEPAPGETQQQVVIAFLLGDEVEDPPAVASQFIAPNRLEVYARRREVVILADPPVVSERKRRFPWWR